MDGCWQAAHVPGMAQYTHRTGCGFKEEEEEKEEDGGEAEERRERR